MAWLMGQAALVEAMVAFEPLFVVKSSDSPAR